MKKLYYRFGDIPEDGYSSIWRIDELIGKEKGVSVYEAYYYGSRYLVTGDLLDERGSDGEPLIKNVKIIKKL